MFGLRFLWRDWRGGELGVLASSIIIAVAIVTGISLFVTRLQGSIVSESRNFLAADNVLQSANPIDNTWLIQADGLGLEQAKVVNFQSMVFADNQPEDSTASGMQLASIKAVSNSYPLLGKVEISDKAFTPGQKVAEAPKVGEVWVDSRLLPLLNLNIGDRLQVGATSLVITQVVINVPDNAGGLSNFGPRIVMSADDLPATNIIQPGSRVEYRYLFSGSDEQLDNFRGWLKEKTLPSQRWLGLEDAQPRISKALDRAERFLLLAGALGVGLAGIAIALAARRYSERHYDYVAMMKSLGATSSKIITIYTVNLLVLTLLATVIGCAIGWGIQQTFIVILQDYFDVSSLPAITLKPFLIGAVTALACLMAFALPPLLYLQGASPLRVLRRDLDRSRFNSALSYIMGVGGIGLLMYWYSGNVALTMAVLVGVALTFLIVGVLAWYLLRGSTAVGMQAGSTWRLALASMRRRGKQNAVQTVIFSLAIMLLLMLSLIRGSLIDEWKVQLPEGTPNHFLVNVADNEVPPVERLLAENGMAKESIYPLVRGRLYKINGDLLSDSVDPNVSRDLDRELNLTWSEELPFENILTEGKWWQPGSNNAEVSVEESLATRLNLKVGDELSFKLGSEELVATLTSVRRLNWDTMRPNFYMMFPPGLLQDYSATYITSFYLPQNKKIFLNQFLREFPTITVIEMDAIIRQIRSIIDQISSAIELVLGLIIISGLLVLIASVQASLDSRFQESAILRTLGAKRELVLGSLIIEFAFLGMLAGFLAAISAELSVFGLQTYVLDMEFVLHPWVWIAGPIIGAILIGTAGYVTCRKVVNTAPMTVLREL